MLLRDDGEEVTPYDDDEYINSRLQIVSSDFVVDKDDWEPYVVRRYSLLLLFVQGRKY